MVGSPSRRAVAQSFPEEPKKERNVAESSSRFTPSVQPPEAQPLPAPGLATTVFPLGYRRGTEEFVPADLSLMPDDVPYAPQPLLHAQVSVVIEGYTSRTSENVKEEKRLEAKNLLLQSPSTSLSTSYQEASQSRYTGEGKKGVESSDVLRRLPSYASLESSQTSKPDIKASSATNSLRSEVVLKASPSSYLISNNASQNDFKEASKTGGMSPSRLAPEPPLSRQLTSTSNVEMQKNGEPSSHLSARSSYDEPVRISLPRTQASSSAKKDSTGLGSHFRDSQTIFRVPQMENKLLPSETPSVGEADESEQPCMILSASKQAESPPQGLSAVKRDRDVSPPVSGTESLEARSHLLQVPCDSALPLLTPSLATEGALARSNGDPPTCKSRLLVSTVVSDFPSDILSFNHCTSGHYYSPQSGSSTTSYSLSGPHSIFPPVSPTTANTTLRISQERSYEGSSPFTRYTTGIEHVLFNQLREVSKNESIESVNTLELTVSTKSALNVVARPPSPRAEKNVDASSNRSIRDNRRSITSSPSSKVHRLTSQQERDNVRKEVLLKSLHASQGSSARAREKSPSTIQQVFSKEKQNSNSLPRRASFTKEPSTISDDGFSVDNNSMKENEIVIGCTPLKSSFFKVDHGSSYDNSDNSMTRRSLHTTPPMPRDSVPTLIASEEVEMDLTKKLDRSTTAPLRSHQCSSHLGADVCLGAPHPLPSSSSGGNSHESEEDEEEEKGNWRTLPAAGSLSRSQTGSCSGVGKHHNGDDAVSPLGNKPFIAFLSAEEEQVHLEPFWFRCFSNVRLLRFLSTLFQVMDMLLALCIIVFETITWNNWEIWMSYLSEGPFSSKRGHVVTCSLILCSGLFFFLTMWCGYWHIQRRRKVLSTTYLLPKRYPPNFLLEGSLLTNEVETDPYPRSGMRCRHQMNICAASGESGVLGVGSLHHASFTSPSRLDDSSLWGLSPRMAGQSGTSQPLDVPFVNFPPPKSEEEVTHGPKPLLENWYRSDRDTAHEWKDGSIFMECDDASSLLCSGYAPGDFNGFPRTLVSPRNGEVHEEEDCSCTCFASWVQSSKRKRTMDVSSVSEAGQTRWRGTSAKKWASHSSMKQTAGVPSAKSRKINSTDISGRNMAQQECELKAGRGSGSYNTPKFICLSRILSFLFLLILLILNVMMSFDNVVHFFVKKPSSYMWSSNIILNSSLTCKEIQLKKNCSGFEVPCYPINVADHFSSLVYRSCPICAPSDQEQLLHIDTTCKEVFEEKRITILLFFFGFLGLSIILTAGTLVSFLSSLIVGAWVEADRPQ